MSEQTDDEYYEERERLEREWMDQVEAESEIRQLQAQVAQQEAFIRSLQDAERRYMEERDDLQAQVAKCVQEHTDKPTREALDQRIAELTAKLVAVSNYLEHGFYQSAREALRKAGE